jgi:23S rRNA pseudouridine2605 synthase
MARPRTNKGKGTSFGKRSDAEKSFKRKKSFSGRDDKRPFTERGDSKSKRPSRPSGSSGSDRPKGFGKPSGYRSTRKDEGSSFGPPRKSSFDKPERKSFGEGRRDDRRGPGSEGKRPFSKPFRADSDREKRPYRKEGGSFRPRTEGAGGPPRARFSRGDDAEKRPFRKSDNPSFGAREERAPRFPKPEEREGGFKKPFDKDGGFKKPFKKDGDSFKPRGAGDEGSDSEKKPFRGKESLSFDRRGDGKPREERGGFRKTRDGDEENSASKPRLTSADFTRPAKKEKGKPAEETPVVRKEKAKPAEEFHPVRKERSKPKDEVRAEVNPGDGLTRLNKYIANSGVGSRREADKLITMGLISVNGTTITELGTKVKHGDVVRYEDRILKAEKLVYILLNKPKGFITTTDDPQERNTVMALVAGACKERVYPVGRLDRNTTGILLITNDGDLADKLTHPSYQAKKVYRVELDKPLTKNDFQKIMDGVHLEEGRAMVDDLAIISDDNKTVGLEIHIGWNRVVRRIFESLEYAVVKLDRSVYAGLDKKDTPRGQWRFLKAEEIVRLKHFK